MSMGLEKTTSTKEPQRHVFARWVSAIIHPIAFPLLTLGVVTYIATASFVETSRWLLLAVALTSLPVAVLVGIQVLRGRWTDLAKLGIVDLQIEPLGALEPVDDSRFGEHGRPLRSQTR